MSGRRDDGWSEHRRTWQALAEQMEPIAVAHQDGHNDMALASIAVSLKRIADVLDPPGTASLMARLVDALEGAPSHGPHGSFEARADDLLEWLRVCGLTITVSEHSA